MSRIEEILGRDLQEYIIEAILHHSLTKDQKTVDTFAIDRYHTSWAFRGDIITKERAQELIETGYGEEVKSPWSDNGYNYLIEMANGKVNIYVRRPIGSQGAHTRGHNSRTIGICIVGNYDKDKLPPEIMEALVLLLAALMRRYGFSKISKHHKYANYKSCPGDIFPFKTMLMKVGYVYTFTRPKLEEVLETYKPEKNRAA